MSALTYEVADPSSPVALWLRSTFPSCRDIQAEYRQAAGVQQVLMPAGVAAGTQGAAVDFMIRFETDPAPSIALPLSGLAKRRVPCINAGLGLLRDLAPGREVSLERAGLELRAQPSALGDRDNQWWARTCYALALLVELFRAASIEGSRLFRLDESSNSGDLLALANDAEVSDLIAMRDLARRVLLPGLPSGRVSSGMTFDGSRDLAGDADLIAGDMLIDIKSGQGGKPRKDGSRAASLARTDLDQLLGYLLMDYSDQYHLQTVGVYAARFGFLAAWPVAELIERMAGRPLDLARLRGQFRDVLRSPELAAHQRQRIMGRRSGQGDR